ncbi:MAG: 50S ribosomal protein L30 [Candidatus Heimdallarchaeota archaeon]|nr:50S ribosomal protein L30 [Candidatus Heimdallarchaeota archaeon]MDH5644597.1 50S ribosomal protein L30 [Candidatus Heimdallarchaeota archaeon]
MTNAVAIVRLRGKVNRNYDVEHTMKLLRLHKPNHAVIFPNNEAIQGMLQKIKDAVTWGEIDQNTVEILLKKRGELKGKDKVTDKHIKTNTSFSTIKQFAKAVASGEAKITDIPDIQPVFRLTPPRKGFTSLKNPYNRRGDLGYRGSDIITLIDRMT